MYFIKWINTLLYSWDTHRVNKLLQNHCDVAVGTVFGILSVKNLHDRIKTPGAMLFLESIHDTYQPYLTPNIHIQILQTDLYTFPKRVSWENLIEDQIIFLLVIDRLILTTFPLGCVFILFGENWCWSLSGLTELTLTLSAAYLITKTVCWFIWINWKLRCRWSLILWLAPILKRKHSGSQRRKNTAITSTKKRWSLTGSDACENQSIGGVFREKVLTHIVFKEEFTAFSF